MGLQISRREWLKASGITAAGLLISPNFTGCGKGAPALPSLSGEEDFIRLNNNESPFGISERAIQAISNSIGRSSYYPHRHYPELKELIAERERISPDHIVLGAGSTEVMTTLIHFCREKGGALAADPTYFDFVFYAENAGCPLYRVPLTDNFEHDLEAMEERIGPDISMVYICNPNNPTGTITPEDRLSSFCERASEKALVVVDEAYHEYVEDLAYGSMMDLVRDEKNVIVTRTFSKIFGLAGLRIGYGMAKPDIIKDLEKRERNFAPVSYLSLKAAVASYQDMEFTRSIRQKNREVKSYICRELEKLGFFYVPSHTNFVFFKINKDGREAVKELEGRLILVRSFPYKDGNWIRVSLGTKDEMKAFVSALAEISPRVS